MRRRWEVNEVTVAAVVTVWFCIGTCVFIALSGSQNRTSTLGLALWLGPYALAALVALPFAAVAVFRYLRENPPVRRVRAPVTRDLRETD